MMAPLPPWDTRVLVVDDDRISRMLLSALLGNLGITRIDAAGDGMAALAMATRQHYDAIFMDCRMPGMDGYATARALRARGVTARIVALTGTTQPGDRARCLAAGMEDCLSKPIDRGTLERTLYPPAAPPVLPAPDATRIDRAQLRLVAGSDEAMAGVLALFFELAGTPLGAMEAACASGDAAPWTEAAHYLKGSAAAMGMAALARACAEAEAQGNAASEVKRAVWARLCHALEETARDAATLLQPDVVYEP